MNKQLYQFLVGVLNNIKNYYFNVGFNCLIPKIILLWFLVQSNVDVYCTV